MTVPLGSQPRLEWNAGNVRALRRFLGMSQSMFAAELGVRQQTVSEWETGVYRPRGASATLLTMIASNSGFIHERPGHPAAQARDRDDVPVVATAGRVMSDRTIDPVRLSAGPPPRASLARPEIAI